MDEELSTVTQRMAGNLDKLEKLIIRSTLQVRRSVATFELEKEGYVVPESVKEIITMDSDISKDQDTIRTILDDKTGFTAAMYGINLDEEENK
ncbi:hypothetical protein R2E40_10195 [Aeromonas sp. CD]|uniref:hypothetical protein n=1 Tax=Aeromonas sp. CD TaxID=3080830 RepID=UPI0029660824|nr:hypothetical protein [Aeromonas sp. CD]WOX54459.1 hypothetical protein R2E40_10195 [Aeromonas sp. CD]